MKPENPQAFPQMSAEFGTTGVGTSSSPGMSLRDWFAGMALQGMCTDYSGADSCTNWAFDDISKAAYTAADAMLIERSRTP